MSGWAGFTDAELQRMKGPPGRVESVRTGVRKLSNFTKPKASSQQKTISQQRMAETQSSTGQTGVISPEQRLSRPPNNNTESEKKRGNGQTEKSISVSQSNANIRDSNGNVEVAGGVSSKNVTSLVEEVKELELNQDEALSHQMSKLEKYQEQQKMIEELNKQRKQLLSKAITERSKKAKAETSKLKHIEKELSHLDHQLAGGVTIIRDRIEQASIAYLDAQHKYEKAEKEFIHSKMDLHEKAEKKEQLTEHLYTIIHQNEIRKSQKLAELMKQLEMDISADQIDIKLDLPPLSSFNVVQTLSPTKSHKSPLFPESKENGPESKIADSSATTEKPESKIADSSAATGSQPHSAVAEKTDFQPIKTAEQTDVCLTQNSNKNNEQISQNLEQKLPELAKESINTSSCKGQESPTDFSKKAISQTESLKAMDSEKPKTCDENDKDISR